MPRPLTIAFFGSGAFGVPTLAALNDAHRVGLVVTQPDRPAGRSRRLAPTPVGHFAADHDLPTIKPQRMDDPELHRRLADLGADAWIVIAYGHKLPADLLGDSFAINLHASLLPKYRGAAPINRAMMAGETVTGVSVIGLAQRMDAGPVYAQRRTKINPYETAGELHDRLAELGPDVIEQVLSDLRAGTLSPSGQDDAQATAAPKLTKAEGTVSFDQPAEMVRARVHGLTPWPGCTIHVDDATLKMLRVEARAEPGETSGSMTPGTVLPNGLIVCAPGLVRLLSVQPPGGRAMTFEAYRHGHRIPTGAVCAPLEVAAERVAGGRAASRGGGA